MNIGNKRILIGKPGLDGHDRGAKYIAQVLRDAGFEVIYTGIRRTPEQIVHAAVQEGVAAVGLSLLSGAHMELFGRVIGLLRDAGAGDVALFGGGVIPAEDAARLREMGVAAVFTPGTPTASIVETIERHLVRPAPRLDAAARAIAEAPVGDPRRVAAAARLMTLLDDAPQRLPEAVDAFRAAGGARSPARLVLGLTGAPGAGKSTLAAALVGAFRRARPAERVGVVAVDPSSAVTSGAILGDRIRMMHLSDDPLVFVRSLATRGEMGGLSRGVAGVVGAMELLGCAVVVVETVGVGQNESRVAQLADVTALVMAPGQGDDIQLMKAGVLEVADVVLVNKADQPDADLLHEQVLSAQRLRAEVGGRRDAVHVAKVSAVSGGGVDEVVRHLNELATARAATWQARRP